MPGSIPVLPGANTPQAPHADITLFARPMGERDGRPTWRLDIWLQGDA